MSEYLLLLETDEQKKFFTSVYEEYREKMFNIANNILHNLAEAEETVHETFLSLVNHVERLMDSEPHKLWYYIGATVKCNSYDLLAEGTEKAGAE